MRRLTISLTLLALLASCGENEVVATDIEARITPSRTWYHTGQEVMLAARVLDQNLEPVEMPLVEWTVEPAGAATGPTAGPEVTFTLDTEGLATFTACVPQTPEEIEAGIEPLCDSVNVRVDDGMPTLEVSSPQPGDELTGDEGIVVTGSVADRSMVNVYINGVPAEVDEMGQFEGAIEAFFGTNHVVVTASDGLTDVSEVEMDVLWAPAYTPALTADGRPLLQLDDGLALWLGQGFFDDGAPIDVRARPAMTDDLADVLALVIGSLDPNGFIPDPVVDSGPSFTLRVMNASIGDPTVEIDVTDDGAELFVRLGAISADTSGALMIEGTSLPLTGRVSGSAVAFAPLTIRKDGPDAALEVEMGELVVGLESVQGEFVSPETAAVFRLAEGLFRTTLEDALVDALQETLASTVPDVLRDALGAIDTALSMQSIELDSAPFPPVRVEIDGRIAQLRSSFRRDLTATLRTEVGTTSMSVFPESRGVPRVTTLPALPFVNEGSMQLGVRLALLNGLLHSLWASGLLDVDATSILPDAVSGLVSEARLVGRLQPVLRPPRPEEEDALVLTVGQLELELLFMGEVVRFGMTLDAGVDITLADNRLAVDVSEEPRLRIWVLQPPSNPRLLTASTVETLLLDLWPTLRESVVGGLSFDLPIPALGDLGGVAPGIAELSLSLDRVNELRFRRGVLVMEAELTGTLP